MKNEMLNSTNTPTKSQNELIKSVQVKVKDIEKSKECNSLLILVASVINSYQKSKDQKPTTRRTNSGRSGKISIIKTSYHLLNLWIKLLQNRIRKLNQRQVIPQKLFYQN